MGDRRLNALLTRRTFLRASAGLGAAALVACGTVPGRQSPSPWNAGAAKADGRILFAKAHLVANGGNDDGIYALQNGSTVTKLLSKSDGDYALQFPRWSPDAKQIAVVRAGDRGIFADLWIVAVDGSNSARQITDFQSKVVHKNNVDAEKSYVADSSIVAGVSWSRGGNFLTFVTNKGNPGGVMRPWTLEQPAQPVQLTNLHDLTATANFSPPNLFPPRHIDDTVLSADGRAMAFSALWVQPDDPNNKQTQIYLLDFATKKYAQLTDVPIFKWGAYDPAFSPDGQMIAFAARPDYRINDIYVMGRDGKNPVRITTTGAARSPVWSPDGTKLAFLAAFEGAQFNIYVMDVAPAAPGTALTAANFGPPVKLTDEQGIDASSGLSWAQS